MGATVPESAGLYFSWGNTEGHPSGAQYDFSQAVYDTTPAAAITNDLSLSEDAARTNLGAPWRMPTSVDFQELYDNCAHVWTAMNGVNGYLITSNVNGNTLFIPAAGEIEGMQLKERGSVGNYWTSSYYSDLQARRFYFGRTNIFPQSYKERYNGFTVRAVQDGTPNRSIVPPTPEDKPKDEETATVEEPKDSNER